MAKEFNITGVCVPEKHYMSDTSRQVGQTLKMVEKGQYFVINRPRQYGKTTMLSQLDRALTKMDGYEVFRISFEGIGDSAFRDEKIFSEKFINRLIKDARFTKKELVDMLKKMNQKINDFENLSTAITDLIENLDKKLVLLIDEVDKSSNNQLFLSFLGMLRDKYLEAQEGRDYTFHSVVLTGVHDIKTLKLKLRQDEEAKLNSPWNIAADFVVDMNLHATEIIPMLEEYAADRKVKMDTATVAEKLFYYTSGNPFLVSKLCKMMDEEVLPAKTTKDWTLQELEQSVQKLVGESNANFDSLTKNLENYPKLYDLTYRVIIEGEHVPFIIHDPVVNLGVLHGIFSNPANNGIQIHNRVYREVIANFMTIRMLRSEPSIPKEFHENYLLAENRLDVEKILTKFQAFMKEQYNKKDRDFLERHGRLVFLSFLKPIINGKGYSFKEPQISEEKRLDIAITFYQYQYLVELKIWRGEKAHVKGLQQLASYLEKQGLSEGYLVIFDHAGVKSWRQEQLKVEGKQVFAVWV